jgi:endogenous inhibitor of DNA gyrase (YacG/DUF329 family)
VSHSANKTRTATRLCASCGEPFTWTSRNPKRRFCDPVCKSRWWRASNNDTDKTRAPAAPAPTAALTAAAPDDASAVTSTASTDRADTTVTTNAVTQPYDPYVAGYANGQTPSAIQNCPNCHQPVAVINLLVTSAAAYVNTPSRSVTKHS